MNEQSLKNSLDKLKSVQKGTIDAIAKIVEIRDPYTSGHQHHERMDGSGYPAGLKGGEILQEARIIGVADVVEAMAYHRPYRPSLSIDTALDEIGNNKGTLDDPEVVDVCLDLFRKKGFKFE